ncbi:MAG: aminotransferase class III-fold pyridoxal phosphate-dependent enzyme [Armatimonadetes bacterium]|nr:aminotransferase class III-fold pyridoxal phosphate-dependent enzyme [Armatimonadota bacterium]
MTLQVDQELSKHVSIKTPLPGPKAKEIIEKEKKYVATGTKCWETPAVPARGQGVWFQDVDGNVLMDWTNGMVDLLGHSHPKWVQEVSEQLQKYVYFNAPDFPSPLQADIAETLCRLAPGDFPKKVFFSSTGTEAVEAAYKVARIGTKRNMIMSFLGDFHGRTTGSLATTTSKSVQRQHYTPYLTNTYALPFAYCYRCWYTLEYPSCDLHCAHVIKRYLKTVLPPEDVAAFVFEPVQGEGGYVVPPVEFFQILSDIAKSHGILLIADEVQTCFGKSGYWFASEHFGIVPHIVAMAKGLANGAPMGATTLPAELDFPKQGIHSNTFGGQAISCAASLATVKIIKEEKLLDEVKSKGKYFKDKLMELKDKFSCIGDVRTLGFLMGVEFVKDRKTKEPAKELRNRIVEECYQSGLLILSCGESGIRITPPFVITRDEIDLGVGIIQKGMEKALRQ